MKHISIFSLGLFIIFIGCKKDNSQDNTVPKVEYPGNYSFTTIYHNPNADTTILYDGSISYDDWLKQWTVRFLPNQTIYPEIDTNGVMTYPEFVNNTTNHFFSGNLDGTGNVNFKYGYSIEHFGETYLTSYTVKGKKK